MEKIILFLISFDYFNIFMIKILNLNIYMNIYYFKFEKNKKIIYKNTKKRKIKKYIRFIL